VPTMTRYNPCQAYFLTAKNSNHQYGKHEGPTEGSDDATEEAPNTKVGMMWLTDAMVMSIVMRVGGQYEAAKRWK
jgi:hypothetical protein